MCPQCQLAYCGACLDNRYGQNMDEVLRLLDWECPVCLEICNCSSKTCVRFKQGLKCTNQLAAEATALNYRSVAHYLIISALVDRNISQTELEKMQQEAQAMRAARCAPSDVHV